MARKHEIVSPSPSDPNTEEDPIECLFQVECLQQPSAKSPHKMDNVYIVRPTTIWASLNNYEQFIVNNEPLTLSSTIHVLRSPHPEFPQQDPNPTLGIARVLEVRAKNPRHVYLRVFWLYHPAGLPGGWQAHHGDQELIVSNHMTIIDASAVLGSVHVRRWDEHTQESPPQGLFWRQTIDIATETLSPPKPHCICSQPLNPSSTPPLLRCRHCSLRMHESCIADIAFKALNERAALGKQMASHKNGNTIIVAPITTASKKKQKARKHDRLFDVKVMAADDGRAVKLLVEDRRGGKVERWEEGVVCLGCRKPL